MASFFDSMETPSAAEPSSGMYRATVDFDAIESALAIPVALRRGRNVLGSTELSPKQVHSSTGGGRAADASSIPSQSATPVPPPEPLHPQGVAVRSHQPAVRSVAGVQLPSWAVVGGSRQEQRRYEQSNQREQARPGSGGVAVPRHVAPSKEPAPAKTPAAASAENQSAAYMLQHQEYLQRQEQRRYDQSNQREQSQAQEQQMYVESPPREAAHHMLMRRAVVQPQARRSRLGAAGALGYTDAGPVVTENPYTVDLIGVASQGRRQPVRASRRANRLGSRSTEQQQQSSGEGSGSFAHGFGEEGEGSPRKIGSRRFDSDRFGSAAHNYSMQADTAAEMPAGYRRGGAPRMLPSLGGLAMGLGGGGPLHGRRSVLGT